MVKLVLRLSPVAKIGAVFVLVGVAFGIYSRMQAIEWAGRVSIVLVVIGAILYYASRIQSFRQKRKV